MSACFADTFYHLAFANRTTNGHERSRALTKSLRSRIVTTEFVLLEVADAMSLRASRSAFLQLLRIQQASRAVEIVPVSSSLFRQGIELFGQRPDKDWPLTDCISFVVMQERGIREALTADRHFEQAGFVALLRD